MIGYDFTAYFAGKTAQTAYPLFMRDSIRGMLKLSQCRKISTGGGKSAFLTG